MPIFIIKTGEKINRIFSRSKLLFFVDPQGELKREKRQQAQSDKAEQPGRERVPPRRFFYSFV
jgi:hypothetical protein